MSTGDRRQPKEQEHEDVPQAVVAQGERAGCVEDSCDHAGQPDAKNHPARHRRQIDTNSQRPQLHQNHSGHHLTLAEQAGRHRTGWADPLLGVRSLSKVEEVVRKVRSDLE